MARILVTGGAGFIGSHLCGALLQDGQEVVCYDDLSSGKEANIREYLTDPRFTFIKGDVRELPEITADRIYHLACPASPVYYQKDPVRTALTSVLGAVCVLENARRSGARVLYTSTSEIYGDPLEHPQRESYHGNVNPIGPRACYDEGKRMAETLFFDYHRQYGTDIRVVRIFNTYGPKMAPDDGRVISNFITEALTGQNLTVYGDGSQTRSFCFVTDTVRALRLMMEQEGFTGPVNIGNPDERTIEETAREVLALVGGCGIRRLPLPTDDPVRRKPDITLAKEKLGWKPEVAFADGLRMTFDYFRKRNQ